MTNNNLRVVEVVEYNPNWHIEFKEEAHKLRDILKDEIVEIHHIGSTSIPNMSAKPVIDILLEVRDINAIDYYNEKIQQIGYIPKGEYGIRNRRFFLKGENDRTHHIHAFETGDTEIKRHLNFRDYMINHPEEAEEYKNLKKDLAYKFKYDIDKYIEGKDAFIKNIDLKAKQEFTEGFMK
ncbi:GrpB domain, predicted nucleotidyltransferase, UPF0157 family [Clostridium collagenovorans DSM 3089]|uniref:GrpB domain, predicted nucleotidyltransferase, UPF0157 family n=1 Tax=Clostridium collagenovorans DSM 3089 TaxID=1121306 RepID=A0A1M5VD87_9CLOT|nr:GrpB family protein [Clostridium collagenovorans]SHH73166.1 GrpB domain, predicted nucleotidyltransferase, UPF0157 family [Clostridium collagenovorans DSM 3089]